MQTTKSNLVWKSLLILIFLRPFICQRSYPALDNYYCLLFLFCFLLWLVFRPKTSFKSQLNYPLLLICIAIVISTLFSLNLHLSLREINKFILYLAGFYLMTKATLEQRKETLLTLIIAGSLLSLYGIYQYCWGFQHILDYLSQTKPYLYGQEFLSRKRIFATFLSPNMFAGYLVIIIPLAIGQFLDSQRSKSYLFRTLLGLSLSVMLIALVLTESIGGCFSLLAAFLVFSALLFFSHRHLRRDILLGSAIICASLILLLAGIFMLRIDYLSNINHHQNSIAQRLYFWSSTTRIIKDFPFTGIGLGNFGFVYPNYKYPSALQTQFSHNSYLQFWAEAGILGLLGWFWLIFQSFRVGLRNLTSNTQQSYVIIALLTASSSFLIHNLTDFSFFLPEVALHWWLVLGLIIYLPSDHKKV